MALKSGSVYTICWHAANTQVTTSRWRWPHMSMWRWNITKPSGCCMPTNSTVLRLRSCAPVFDAMLRAFWLNKLATKEQIEQVFNDLKFPNMRQLREQIRQAYFSDAPPEEALKPEKTEAFFQILEEAWGATSSYTHSGSQQLGRRFQPNGELKPNYSQLDIVQALSLATVALLLLAHMFFVSMGRPQEVEDTLALIRQFSDDFGARFRSGQRESRT
jgi:hypothetical protein